MKTSSNDLKHHYQTLELPETATKKDIKNKYRELAKQWHPDVEFDKGDGNKFIKLKQSYDALIKAIEQRSQDHELSSSSRQHFHPFTDPDLLSEEQQHIKSDLLQKFRSLLAHGHSQQVVQGVKELAVCLQNDPDIRQIQAKAYFAIANMLVRTMQVEQVEAAYHHLQTAVLIDPRNKVICNKLEVVSRYLGRLREWDELCRVVEQECSQTTQTHSYATEFEQTAQLPTEYRYSYKKSQPKAQRDGSNSNYESTAKPNPKSKIDWTEQYLPTLITIAIAGFIGCVFSVFTQTPLKQSPNPSQPRPVTTEQKSTMQH